MKKKIIHIFFSPTNATKIIGKKIIDSFREYELREIDLTKKIFSDIDLDKDGIAIIGMPVYRSALPEVAIERLKKIKASGIPAVIYIVYGNRGYGQALQELKQSSYVRGFIPVAQGTYIGEHSFSTTEYPIAVNRPDKDDLEKAKMFGDLIKENIAYLESIEKISLDIVSIERKEPLRIPPGIDLKCNLCGKCIDMCPVRANDFVDNSLSTNKEKCITCMACVKGCPNNARYIKSEQLLNIAKQLFNATQERKNPEYELLV